MAKELILLTVGRPSGIKGDKGDPGSTGGTPAPNVTATATTQYLMVGNDQWFGWSGVITVPTGDPDISHLKWIEVFAIDPNGLETSITTLEAPFSATENYSGRVAKNPSTDQTGWSLRFQPINEYGNPTANPFTVTGLSVDGSRATACSASDTGSTVNSPGDNDRLQYVTVTFGATLYGNHVPNSVSFMLSKDNGATWMWIGFDLMTSVGQTFTLSTPRPAAAGSWKVAMCAGFVGGVGGVLLNSLPSGFVSSNVFTVQAMGLPSATDITSLTVASGAGGDYPYDTQTPDGQRYWAIAYVQWDDTGAVNDTAAAFVRITAQDLDLNHNPIAPERPFDGFMVMGRTQKTMVLMGQYGTTGDGYVRSGNLAFVRLKAYVINRIDQTYWSFQNSAASRLQTGIGSGAGYVDALVAVGGVVPPGALNATRIDPNTLDPTLNRNPGTGKLGTYSTIGGNLFNNPGFEDGLNWWSVAGSPLLPYILDPPWPMSGQHCLLMQGSFNSLLYTKRFTVVAGERYTVRWWGYYPHPNLINTTGYTMQAVFRLWSPDGGTFVDTFVDYASQLQTSYSEMLATFVVPNNGYNSLEIYPITFAQGATSYNLFVDNMELEKQVRVGSGMRNDDGVIRPRHGRGLTTNTNNENVPTAQDDANLILNPQFELGSAEWTTNYGVNVPGVSDIQFITGDTANARTGSGYVKIRAGNPNGNISVYQVIGVRPSTEYTFSGWFKNLGSDGQILIYVNYWRNDQSYISAAGICGVSGSTGGVWSKAQAVGTTPTDCSFVQLHVVVLAGANYWLADDVKMEPSTEVTGPLAVDGTGRVTVTNGGITNPYLGAQAVQAVNMAAAAVTQANGAIAANAVVDGNITAMNVSKLLAGTVIFTGDTYFSRGASQPVIALSNAGMYLYGVANGAGTGGLTSQPYVAIQSSGIGLYSGANPAVTINSASMTFWSVNGNTSNPYTTIAATGITIASGNNTAISISSSALTLYTVNGNTGFPYMTMTSSQLQMINGSFILTVGNSTIQMQSSGGYIYLNSSGLLYVVTAGQGLTYLSGTQVVTQNMYAQTVYIQYGGNTIQVTSALTSVRLQAPFTVPQPSGLFWVILYNGAYYYVPLNS